MGCRCYRFILDASRTKASEEFAFLLCFSTPSLRHETQSPPCPRPQDLIGPGRLSPDWVYETRPAKLTRLQPEPEPQGLGLLPAGAPACPGLGPVPSVPRGPWDGAALGCDEARGRGLAAFFMGHRRSGSPFEASRKPLERLFFWMANPFLGEAPACCSPEVQLEVRRALPCEWQHFREHHYKDHGTRECI